MFILWGSHARSKKALIDTARHTVIESAHPSPLSAHNGFFGSKPFSRDQRRPRRRRPRPRSTGGSDASSVCCIGVLARVAPAAGTRCARHSDGSRR